MTLVTATNAVLEFGGIHPFFAGLLLELPRVAGQQVHAEQRLYPAPTASGEEDLCADWRELVRPELENLFASNRELVAQELAAWKNPESGTPLQVHRGHVDAWLNTLNQARLIIVEKNRFTEADLDTSLPPDLATRRGLALLKVHFYAHVQELMIEAVA
jgi:hypothetical protein